MSNKKKIVQHSPTRSKATKSLCRLGFNRNDKQLTSEKMYTSPKCGMWASLHIFLHLAFFMTRNLSHNDPCCHS